MFAVPTMLRRMSTSAELPRLRRRRAVLPDAGRGARRHAGARGGQRAHRRDRPVLGADRGAGVDDACSPAPRWGGRELWSSIGRPVPGVEFSVLSDGEVLDRPEPGVDGELVIRTPSVATALMGGERGARGAAAARRLVADLRPRPLRRRRAGSTSSAGRARRSSPAARTSSRSRSSGPSRRMRPCARRSSSACRTRSGARRRRRTSTSRAERLDGRSELDEWLRSRLAGFKRPRHVFLSRDPSRAPPARPRSPAGRSRGSFAVGRGAHQRCRAT